MLNTASFYLLGYPNESPQKIEALTTPLTWTIDSITVARDAALPSGGGTAQTPKLTVDSNLAIEGDQLKDQDTGHSVYFRGWTGGTLALGTEPGQAVWKTVKESTTRITLPFRAMGPGGWTDGGFWTLRDDARLVFEVKVRVKPETEGQGVRHVSISMRWTAAGRRSETGGPRPWTLPWTARSMRSGILSIRPSGNMSFRLTESPRRRMRWPEMCQTGSRRFGSTPPVTTAARRAARMGPSGRPEYAGQLYV